MINQLINDIESAIENEHDITFGLNGSLTVNGFGSVIPNELKIKDDIAYLETEQGRYQIDINGCTCDMHYVGAYRVYNLTLNNNIRLYIDFAQEACI